MRKTKKEKSLSVLLYFSLFFLIFFYSFINKTFPVLQNVTWKIFFSFYVLCMMQYMQYKSYFSFFRIFYFDFQWFSTLIWKIDFYFILCRFDCIEISKCIQSQGFLSLKLVENILYFVECVVLSIKSFFKSKYTNNK